MTTSKLEKSLTPIIAKDLVAVDTSIITEIVSKAITQYKVQELLKLQDMGNTGKNRTYYLFKRASVKQGYIYNVKYLDPNTGKILPTKYSTGTNDLETAIRWAETNRETCLKNYNGRGELTLFEEYYQEGSKYLDFEDMDGRKLSPLVIKQRHSFMTNHIVPFFQLKKVHSLTQITPIHIKQLKRYLSKEKGLMPQTINYNLHSFKKCLALLKDMGKITTDFSKCAFTVKGSKQAEKSRDIYSIDTLKGIFKKQWDNGLSKLLCMVIYFCGMRNSEILRMCFNDIENIDGVYFLNVRGTKSKNAVRKVPIHSALYKALETYIKKNGIAKDGVIFDGVYNEVFRQASFDMGSLLGYDDKTLIKMGICFYSGRHTYKTILALGNASKVADVSIDFQEMFMGHTFKKEEVKEKGIKEYEYKHLKADKIGNALLAEKGKEVIKILTHYYL
jgi:integrase